MKYIILTLVWVVPLALMVFLVRWALKSSGKIEETMQNWLDTPAGNIFIGCLLLVLGVALFVVVVNKQMEYRNFKKHGVSAQGVISSIESISDGEDTTHEVYVTFTAEGRKYTFKNHYYSSKMRTGDILPVLYYPDNPDKAMVAKHAGVAILFVFGIIFVLSGVALLRTYKMYIT